MMKKKDLLTGEEFEATRSNQNFVNSQNRIKYHNAKANEKRLRSAYINKPLHKNLLILDELLHDKKEIVLHKQFLLGKGVSFGVFTHYATYESKQYRALYHYIFIPLSNDQIKIVKK